MKSGNLNNASKKTRKLIKKVFAEMLGEKKELSKISVSELCTRAEISRGAFYSHYDDIYGVAEDYENELIDKFFDSAKLLTLSDPHKFLDVVLQFINENNDNYRLLCKSDDLLFVAKRLITLVSNKLLEICMEDPRLCNKSHLELEINIVIEGLLFEYIKMCRGYSSTTIDESREFVEKWMDSFIKRRFVDKGFQE